MNTFFSLWETEEAVTDGHLPTFIKCEEETFHVLDFALFIFNFEEKYLLNQMYQHCRNLTNGGRVYLVAKEIW